MKKVFAVTLHLEMISSTSSAQRCGTRCGTVRYDRAYQYLALEVSKDIYTSVSRKMKRAYNPELGRYSVAAQNYRAGDSVFEESVFAFGPKLNSPITCLGCFRSLISEPSSGESNRCLKCKWPLCSKCQDCPEHFEECEIFVNGKVEFYEGANLDIECVQLDCITPLRVLLKKEYDPERWKRDVEPMEDHDAARREIKDEWNADLINVAKYLRGPCKLNRFSEQLIMRVVGILQVNAFEAKTRQGYPLRCLFPQTGILAHCCVPNTIRTIYPSHEYRIKVRALVDIKEAEQLFVSYTYILNGTAERQQHLMDGKYFKCHCARCIDPTELGTHFSSIKCGVCDMGYLTMINPLEYGGDWKCSECGHVSSSSNISQILEPIKTEFNAIETLPYNENRLKGTEKMLSKNHGILHPLHYIQTNLRQNLIQMYGRVDNYILSSLPDSILEYKINLCRLVLTVLDTFEPGLSRSRAATLYELHAPLALLAQKCYLAGSLNVADYKTKLEEAILVLQEAVHIFHNEDPFSMEGSLAKVGKKGLEQLRATVKTLQIKLN